jgi:hypothetical protein
LKKLLSTCRELSTCVDKIESVAGDALSFIAPTYTRGKPKLAERRVS